MAINNETPGEYRAYVAELQAAAHAYIDRGWSVHAHISGKGESLDTKRHTGTRWGTTKDHARVDDWLNRSAERHALITSIGIATGAADDPEGGSGLVVIDVDDADEWQAYLAEKGEPEPVTLAQESSPGHQQLVFAWPERVPYIKTVAGRLAPGVDVRGTGGQFVAPPSKHTTKEGVRYRWLNELEPAELPAWLLADLLKLSERGAHNDDGTPRQRSRLSELLANPPRGVDSYRNQWLFDVAAHHAGMHEQREDLYQQLCWDAVAKLDYGTPGDDFTDEEARRTIQSAWDTHVRNRMDEMANPSETEPLTDVGNARRFAVQHHDEMRYVTDAADWISWDGTRWKPDEALKAHALAKETARGIYDEAQGLGDDARKAHASWAKVSQSRQKVEAMVALARSEEQLQVHSTALDIDPWALNVANGTVDLRTGKLRPHQRGDMLTKLTPVAYDEDATCPRWEQFLREVCVTADQQTDDELITFLWRALGYTLTGRVDERAVFILHGDGRNGKGTSVAIITELLGDYACTLDPSSLMTATRRKGNGANPDLVALRGARFAAASEGEADDKLAAALVKRLAGGNDKITARELYKGQVTFMPTHKLWLATNRKPAVDASDPAVWARLHLVPFLRNLTRAEEDHELEAKLRAELPGILAWAVRGCLEWQRVGLGESRAVTEATDAYRDEMRPLAEFLNDAMEPASTPAEESSKTEVQQVYVRWCQQNGYESLLPHVFPEAMRRSGAKDAKRAKGRRTWAGLKLRTDAVSIETGAAELEKTF
ncbi:MAG: phage/plasmid primase, P4 family [Ktedonobacterales bacterium]